MDSPNVPEIIADWLVVQVPPTAENTPSEANEEFFISSEATESSDKDAH